MKAEKLRECLAKEYAVWAAKTFEELCALTYPIVYENGSGKDDYYNTEVMLFERHEDWIQVGVAVADAGWRSFFPLGRSVVVHADDAKKEPT